MKNLKFLLLSIFLVLISFCSSQAQYDFGNASWNASKKSIELKQDRELYFEGKDYIAYKDKLDALDMESNDCLVYYFFTNEQLTSGSYVLTSGYENSNEYIGEFFKLKELLKRKYGSTLKEDKIWKNKQLKDSSVQQGEAIAKGHLVYKTMWQTENTFIILMLSGQNNILSNKIIFKSKKELRDIEELNL